MNTPTHSLAEHRQIIRNLTVRLIVSTLSVLVFATLCLVAWKRDWSGFGKFICLAGVVVGLIASASDISALVEEARVMRRLGRGRRA